MDAGAGGDSIGAAVSALARGAQDDSVYGGGVRGRVAGLGEIAGGRGVARHDADRDRYAGNRRGVRGDATDALPPAWESTSYGCGLGAGGRGGGVEDGGAAGQAVRRR